MFVNEITHTVDEIVRKGLASVQRSSLPSHLEGDVRGRGLDRAREAVDDPVRALLLPGPRPSRWELPGISLAISPDPVLSRWAPSCDLASWRTCGSP